MLRSSSSVIASIVFMVAIGLLVSNIQFYCLPRALLVSNATKLATRIMQAIDDVIAMLPALDNDENDFVSDYKQQILTRCERYLGIAPEIKDIEL
jgi:hypothetical protein